MNQIVRARGPRKVVNVVAMVRDRFGPVGIVHAADLDAAGSNYLELGHSQLDVVHSEVRKEFCISVKLVAIPRAVPPHADLRKPLAAEHKIAVPTGALQGLRKLIVKLDLE